MDSYMARPRYAPRRPAVIQKHRRTPQSKGWLKRLIALQTIICIILLIMIVIIKGIHISATDFISRQVDYVLSHNVELNSIFNYVENLATDVRNSIAPGSAGKSESGGLLAAEGSGTGVGAGGSDVSTGNGNTADTDMDGAALVSAGNGDTEPNTNDTDGTVYEGASGADSDIGGMGDSFSQPETSVLAASSDGSTKELPEMTAPAHGPVDTPFGGISGRNANVNFHNGIDIVLKPESSIVAAADGEVAEAGISREYGAFVRISHPDGWQTVYAGCSGFIVQKGDKIGRGDVIARVGSSAVSVGYHLHFELWKDGRPVDPLEYISVDTD